MSIARFCLPVPVAACVFVLAACETKVTQENYDKITIGMTQGQVEGILGKGERQDVSGMNISGGGIASGSRTNSQSTYLWKDRNTLLSVTFEDGKVVTKFFQ